MLLVRLVTGEGKGKEEEGREDKATGMQTQTPLP